MKEDKKYFQKQVNKAGTIIENLSNFNYIKATYKNPLLFMAITEDEIMKIFLIKEAKNIASYKKKDNDDDNKIIWIKDKNGLKTIKNAIHPVLEYSKKIVKNYLGKDKLDIDQSMKALDIIKTLDDPKFLNKINKRLSSELQLKRL